MGNELDEIIHRRITELCSRRCAGRKQKRFEQAFGFYREALNLVPAPAEEWEATTWILAAIGDLYFSADMKDKAMEAFADAVRCPGGLGNPFIHLRLGQCCLDLGQADRAADELTRAYMGAGREVFENQDPKYIKFLEERINPPLG